ncbi:MAG: ABC transporter permease [Synergistaceae bacterium]|jgi:sulfonate transport system permease protein|nr:ABC transporter permease [Synergistaceae bacterium]
MPQNRRLERRIRTFALGCLLPVVILASWEYLGYKGIVNRSILPRPSVIWACFVDMIASGRLKKHLLVSASRVVKGFALGGGAGLIFGILCGLSKLWNDLLSSLIGILRPIPMIAWIPILILLLGIDEGSKISLIAIGSFWPVLLNTSRGIRGIDKKLLEVGIMLEKSRFQMLTKVILPAAFPFTFTGIRLGVGNAWSCVVTAEAIAAATGIGYVIMYARELLQPDVLLVGVLSIGFVGLMLDVVLMWIEKRVLRWNEPNE